MKYKIVIVAGARPNFMKIAPIIHELKLRKNIEYTLVHTGQHYDQDMSDIFFTQLDIPVPDINLDVGSGSHAIQTALIMERFEKVCIKEDPDMLLVVGDVNSTMACSLVAAKMGIKIAHYEAGLRSFDKSMPEEINRMVTDSICDYFFTTCQDATDNLKSEGKTDNVFFVGNVMIDTLINQTMPIPLDLNNKYVLVTLHRPSNVDDVYNFHAIMDELLEISNKIPVIFPMHPRTYKNLRDTKYINNESDLHCTGPEGYNEFLELQWNATAVITDSGGIQEETTYLNVPCLTLRDSTERPITITEGTNKLITVSDIVYEVNEILNGNGKIGKIPLGWDGRAAGRLVDVIDYMIRGV